MQLSPASLCVCVHGTSSNEWASPDGRLLFLFSHDRIVSLAERIDRAKAVHSIGSVSHVARVRCVPAVRVVSHGSLTAVVFVCVSIIHSVVQVPRGPASNSLLQIES